MFPKNSVSQYSPLSPKIHHYRFNLVPTKLILASNPEVFWAQNSAQAKVPAWVNDVKKNDPWKDLSNSEERLKIVFRATRVLRVCWWWRSPRPGRSCSRQEPGGVARISQGQGTESCPHSKWAERDNWFPTFKEGQSVQMSKKLFAKASDPWHQMWKVVRSTWTGEHDGEGWDQVPGSVNSEKHYSNVG